MIEFGTAELKSLAIHRVGNQHREEEVFISDSLTVVDEMFEELLKTYFLSSFNKVTETYHFVHEVELSYNVLNGLASDIFENRDNFLEQSANVARHLFDQSNHPHIKEGDLFVTYFDDVIHEGEIVPAIGIFKSECKDPFIKVDQSDNKMIIDKLDGINIKKLDKGALIIKSNEENGYRVFTVDNNSYDAGYWINDFLNIDFIIDKNYETKQYIQLCDAFASDVIAETESKKEQIDFLNQTMKYMDNNEEVDMRAFNEILFDDEELKEDFNKYKKHYEMENDVEIAESFTVAPEVLKKEKKALKNSIKLDTKIQIKFDFNESSSIEKFIEQGYDSNKDMHYYKVYYNRELN